jgi:5'-nucleotidase
MRILITNDDGIHAPGLAVLEAIAHELSDDVWVVAPETDQSGVSHSVSLNDPLRLRLISEKRFAVKGTPSDCAIMGVHHILKDHKPDLLLSGVNRGHNIAEDVTYSGTIAGAIEGTLLGIPSIALSQSFNRATGVTDRLFDCAAGRGAETVFKIHEAGIPRGNLVNVNFPACAPDDVGGVKITRQGRRNQGFLQIEERRDGRRNPYYWIVYGHPVSEPSEGTDIGALAHNMISVTPLKIDLTDEAYRACLEGAFDSAGG